MTEKSYEQEAHEWDKAEHLAAEMEPAPVALGGRSELSSSLAVRFSGEDIETLRQVAETKDMGVTQLVRTWVLERLTAESDPSAVPIAEEFKAVINSMERLMFTVVESSPTGQVRRRPNARVTSAAHIQLPRNQRPTR